MNKQAKAGKFLLLPSLVPAEVKRAQRLQRSMKSHAHAIIRALDRGDFSTLQAESFLAGFKAKELEELVA